MPQADLAPAGRDNLLATVVIPSYNRPGNLVKCLDGVMAGSRLPDQIVVVLRDIDQASQEALAGWREARTQAGLPEPTEMVISYVYGQIPAMELGTEAARGDVVCFIDDDCVVTETWLGRLLSHYADDSVGGVGGRDIVHHGDQIAGYEVRSVGRITWYGRMVGNHHCVLRGGPVEAHHLKGANMSYRRSLMKAFDGNMVRGECLLNDSDAGMWVRFQGYRLIYDPAAAVDHYPAQRYGASTRDLASPQAAYNNSHNWVYCLLKYQNPPQQVVFVLYALTIGQGYLIGLTKYLLALPQRPVGATRQFVAATRGKIAGVVTYLRCRPQIEAQKRQVRDTRSSGRRHGPEHTD
jgi:GT2 family glycosyltransferase